MESIKEIFTQKKEKLQLLFFFLFIFQLLFCIFYRIESWPFTDYRVFEFKGHPGLSRALCVVGLNAENKYIWPDIPQADCNQLTIQLGRSLFKRDMSYPLNKLKHIAMYLEKFRPNHGINSLVLICRRFVVKSDQSTFIEDTPFLKLDLKNGKSEFFQKDFERSFKQYKDDIRRFGIEGKII